MERLTSKQLDGKYHLYEISKITKTTCCDESGKNAFDLYEGTAIDKLGAYEDAEEQGLLLRLPTNRVWFICDAKTKYATIMSKTIDDLCIYDIKELLKGNSKRYFMTKEEAEQALERMEGEHE